MKTPNKIKIKGKSVDLDFENVNFVNSLISSDNLYVIARKIGSKTKYWVGALGTSPHENMWTAKGPL